MFHKEGSIQGRRKKAMDVPVRKSERRKLFERAKSYFEHANVQQFDEGMSQTLDTVLDATFLQGNLSSRSLPMEGGKAWTMILFLKTPTLPSNAETLKKGPTLAAPILPASPEVWPYTSSSQFVWMALEEKHKIIQESPTVPMWAVLVNAVPQLLAPFAIWVPSPVSKFVCRGADLMRAGMRSLPQGREMLPIVVQGNNQPFAVGRLIKPQEAIGVGVKGVGVEIWNVYGDELWKSSNNIKKQDMANSYLNSVGGESFDNGHYGNVGFKEGKWVLPIDDSHDGDSSDNESSEETEQASSQDVDEPQAKPELFSPIAVPETSHSDASKHEEDEKNHDKANNILSHDEILHHAFLRALLAVKNKGFPMPVGTFYAQYVIPNRPKGTMIDLKSTTYKKLGPYLKVQIERGLLQVGPDKKNPMNNDPMALITSFDDRHTDLRGVEKPVDDSQNNNLQNKKLVMVTLYTIPSHWVSLMRLDSDDVLAANATSDDRRGTGMLTAAEARKILDAYIEREELIPSTRRDQVQLDGPLTQILFKNEKDTPEYQLRKDIGKQFMDKLHPAYALVQMPGSKVIKLAKGNPPKVEIEVSMRQSKKFVTRVRGLEDFGIDVAYFCKDVARRLGCSATMEESASAGRPALRKNHVELVYQGNIANEIQALLVDESLSNHGGVKDSEYSVPKQVVQINLRKGVPARKVAK